MGELERGFPQVEIYEVRLRVLNCAATAIGSQQEYARTRVALLVFARYKYHSPVLAIAVVTAQWGSRKQRSIDVLPPNSIVAVIRLEGSLLHSMPGCTTV
jgi:hypothetical protein